MLENKHIWLDVSVNFSCHGFKKNIIVFPKINVQSEFDVDGPDQVGMTNLKTFIKCKSGRYWSRKLDQ